MAIGKLFDIEGTVAPKRGQSGRTLSCVSCGLHKSAQSPKMPPYGQGLRGLMTIGEGPDDADDRLGRPWRGRPGTELSRALRDFGIDLDRDCVSLNTVNCHPPSKRVPTAHEMACCRAKIVDPAIAGHKPRVILLLGGSAVSSVVGSLYSGADDRIGKWRGWAIPVPEWGCWLCPTFHPSYVLREERRPEVRVVWEQDVQAAVDMLREDVPPPLDLRSMVRILRTDDEVVSAIELVRSRKSRQVSFDYETTGLRALLHEPVCASFAQSTGAAYAFMFRDSDRVRSAWAALLSDPDVGKISHNLKFEAEWSYVHFGVDEINWAWDSMQAAHVLDNRPGICGLKHQLFLVFGIRPYDDLISPYLKSVDERVPAAPNRLREFIDRHGEDEALYYCGLDSLGSLRLALRQMKQMGVGDAVQR